MRILKRIVFIFFGIGMAIPALIVIGIYLNVTGKDSSGEVYLFLWYLVSGQWEKIE